MVQVGGLLAAGSDHRYRRKTMDFHGLYLVYAVTVTGGRLRAETDGATQAPSWQPVNGLDELPVLESARLGLRARFSPSPDAASPK